jgi:hypothetical protein
VHSISENTSYLSYPANGGRLNVKFLCIVRASLPRSQWHDKCPELLNAECNILVPILLCPIMKVKAMISAKLGKECKNGKRVYWIIDIQNAKCKALVIFGEIVRIRLFERFGANVD